MKTLRVALSVVLLFAFATPGVRAAEPLEEQIKKYLSRPPEQPMQVRQDPDDPVQIPEELKKNIRYGFENRMALSGHGVLFDIEGRSVKLEAQEARDLQMEILKALRAEKIDPKAVPADVGAKLAAFVKDMDAFASKAQNEKGQSADGDANLDAMRHLTLRALAFRLDDERRSAYLWRDSYLWNHVLRDRRFQYSPEYSFLTERLREILRRLLTQTTYMRDCEAGGVPVPPDFNHAGGGGGGWTRQGDLSTVMLSSSGPNAQVWTWASPSLEGACVALPRGLAGSGGVSGIICQGAESGNACFWDNLDRVSGDLIEWSTDALVIDRIQDGTQLIGCPDCHRSNNVFLAAPDDPTWCRLMRGWRPSAGCAAPSGPNAVNLNLQVTGVVDPIPYSGVSHSRYRPMSGTPSRPGWTNGSVTGCGAGCHLNHGAVSFTVPSMPPACNNDCYWRPSP